MKIDRTVPHAFLFRISPSPNKVGHRYGRRNTIARHSATMQRKRPLLLWTLLTTALPTIAFDFMVDGLCYNRNSDGKSITVTYEKRRIFISLLLAVAGTLSLLAGNLSETEAAAVAARFMSGRTTTPFVAVTAPIARVATKSATVARDYYTFNNASGAGWAIALTALLPMRICPRP